MLVCPICQVEYNLLDNIPLVFTACGHTICSYCLQQMIKFNGIYDLKCPFDNRRPLPNPYLSLNAFPKNYELIKALEDERTLANELAQKEETIKDLNKNLVEYEAKESTLMTRVNFTETQVMKMAIVIIDAEKRMKLLAKENENNLKSRNILQERTSVLENELRKLNEQIIAHKKNERELHLKLEKEANEKKLLRHERDMYRKLYSALAHEHKTMRDKILKDSKFKRETEKENPENSFKGSVLSTDENLTTEYQDELELKLGYQMNPLENKPDFKSTLKPNNENDSDRVDFFKIRKSSSSNIINLQIDLPSPRQSDYSYHLLQSLVSPGRSERNSGLSGSSCYSHNSALETILKGKLMM